MAKIPQPMDYGSRPSLQSNRLDMPGDSEVIIADSLLRAADNFNKVLRERKEKNDRLSYSKAKAQLAAADTRIRREVEEEGDYENYMETYRIRMDEALSEIMPTVTDPNDRQIFDADANLSVERGVSAMAEIRTRRRQDAAAASVIDLADDTQRDILSTIDNASRIDKMLQFQEYVNARVDAGLLDASWAESQVKAFVAETATAQLKTLPLRAQAALLEASIKANPDPESEDFEPTGSLADFLHQDERVEMLRQVEKQLEVEEDLGMAQAAHDRAVNLYRAPTAESFRKRREAITSDKSLSPEQRRQAMVLLNDTEAFEDRNQGRRVDESMKLAQDLIREGKGGGDAAYTYQDFKAQYPDRWAEMGSQQQALLKQYSDNMQQGRPFSQATVMTKVTDETGKELPSYSLWRRMSDAEKAGVDLDSPMWTASFTEDDWRLLTGQQEQARAGNGPTGKDLQTNSQLVRNTLIKGGWIKPQPGDRPVEEHKTYAEVILELDRRTYMEQTRPGRDAKVGYPDFDTRRAILGEIMTAKSFTGGGGFRGMAGRLVGEDWRSTAKGNLMNVYEMTDEEMEEAWLPMKDGPPGMNATEIEIDVGDEVMNVREYLIAWGMQADPDGLGRQPALYWHTDEGRTRLERAWFAYYNNLGDAEIERRLKGQ